MKVILDNRLPRKLLLIFEIMTMALILMYRRESIDLKTILLASGLVILIYTSNIILSKVSSGDLYIFLLVSMLMSIGIIMIYRISSDLGIKQLLWLAIGIIAFFMSYVAVTRINFWKKLMPFYLAAAYGLFVITLALGDRTHGAINWIRIGSVSFQPAEVTKVILVFILACFYSDRKYLEKYKYADYIMMGVVYSFIGLLFIQRDLGTALIFLGIFTGLQYIYTEDRKIIRINIALFSLGGSAAYFIFDHVKIRIMTWLDPWPYINDKGYQITQSLFAIAEGSYFGTGLGRGNPAFIPLSYNDFIFSSITEEMGVFTGIGIIMLFMIFSYRGFKIALRQEDSFYRIIALGITLMFGIQAFIIIGGVTKVIPLTGLTLPFVSYGGTSVVSSFVALGILQGASEKVTREVSR